jgi:hypothetical protein
MLTELVGTSAAFEYPLPSASWHAGYYDPAWGLPVALVAPPTAEMQTNWGWGVGNTRVSPLWRQFQRNYPGSLFYDPRTFQPIPRWPSDTEQLGVYYLRGPW